jgi:hypothetical protein
LSGLSNVRTTCSTPAERQEVREHTPSAISGGKPQHPLAQRGEHDRHGRRGGDWS